MARRKPVVLLPRKSFTPRASLVFNVSWNASAGFVGPSKPNLRSWRLSRLSFLEDFHSLFPHSNFCLSVSSLNACCLLRLSSFLFLLTTSILQSLLCRVLPRALHVEQVSQNTTEHFCHGLAWFNFILNDYKLTGAPVWNALKLYQSVNG